MAALFAIFLLSGCGADLKLTTMINSDGSGTRKFMIEVPDDQMKEVIGGEQALTKTLTDKKPEDLKLEKSTESGKTIYQFVLEFKNPDELASKSAKLLEKPGVIKFMKEGTPFVRKYTFQDANEVKSYFGWASKAILEANLIKADHRDRLINSQRADAVLPGDGSKQPLVLFGSSPVISEKSYPVQGVSVATDISTGKGFTREITVQATSATHNQLEAEQKNNVQEFLKGLSKEADIQVESSGEKVDYRVKLQADTFDKLQELSKPYLNHQNSAFTVVKKSLLTPVSEYADRADLSSFLGRNVQVQGNYTYQLSFPGRLVTDMNGTADVLEDNKPVQHEKRWEQKQPIFQIKVHIKQTTFWYYVAIGALILLAVALVAAMILLYRKYPEKFRMTPKLGHAVQLVQAADSEALVKRYCYECGSIQEPRDNYCYECGTPKTMAERGA